MADIGWTVATLHEHFKALRELESGFRAQLREADQRALEIKAEGDKEAKKIKEEADNKALNLAREIQVYKDEKANELRSQIERERGSYATKDDLDAAIDKANVATVSATAKIEAQIAPLLEFVTSQRGRRSGLSENWGYLIGAVGLLSTLITAIFFILKSGVIH